MNSNKKAPKLPPIYIRDGKECYLDPIRQKLIFITPEETVRQIAISYLINEQKVPSSIGYACFKLFRNNLPIVILANFEKILILANRISIMCVYYL